MHNNADAVYVYEYVYVNVYVYAYAYVYVYVYIHRIGNCHWLWVYIITSWKKTKLMIVYYLFYNLHTLATIERLHTTGVLYKRVCAEA